MKPSTWRYMALVLWALIIACTAAREYLTNVVDPAQTLPPWLALPLNLTFLALPAMGAAVAWRRPGNPIGWMFIIFGVVYVLFTLTGVYAVYALRAQRPAGDIAAWLNSWCFPIALGQLALTTLLFPDGRLLSPRWRWVGWGLAGVIAVEVLSRALSPELYFNFSALLQTRVSNPFGIPNTQAVLQTVIRLSFAAFGALWAAAGVSQILRYRRSTGDERQQLKWFMFSAALNVALSVPAVVLQSIGLVGSPGSIGVVIFLQAGWALMATGIGFAILKYRLYDIDFIINRSLVYGLLSTLLVGLYASIIGISQRLLVPTIGDTTGIVLFILTTVVVAAALTPVKNRLQAVVDRYFVHVHQAAQELNAFSEQTRSILRVIDARAINPNQVARQLLEQAVDAFQVEGGEARLAKNQQLVQVHSVGLWTGSSDLDVPLEYSGRQFGVISLGRRLTGQAYTAQDREALQHAANVVAQTLERVQDAGIQSSIVVASR